MLCWSLVVIEDELYVLITVVLKFHS